MFLRVKNLDRSLIRGNIRLEKLTIILYNIAFLISGKFRFGRIVDLPCIRNIKQKGPKSLHYIIKYYTAGKTLFLLSPKEYTTQNTNTLDHIPHSFPCNNLNNPLT